MGKQRKRPKSILRLKVSGPHIKPGRIPIPELLVICEHAQTAVNRQAEVLRGKPGLRPGPTATVVKAECTLELFSIGRGSAAMSFAGPEAGPQHQADLDLDIEKLGAAAVRQVVTSLRAARKKNSKSVPMDIGVRRSFQEMGKLLNDGVTKVEWIAPSLRGGKRSRLTAVFDEALRARIDETRDSTTRSVQFDGRLEMADFKIGDLKCIVHAPDGQRIPCSFTPDMEDDVYNALRHVTRVSGTAIVNPKTKRTEQITLSSVKVLDPFLGQEDDFFSTKSLEQLTQAQGVDPQFDIRTLKDAWPADEDVEAFLAAIEEVK